MRKKYETNQQILTKDHGQIVLYQRSDHKNPKWQVRIKIDGSTGYTIQSTRTSDVMKATLVATDQYQALVDKFRSTGSTQTRPFSKIEWRKTHGRHMQTPSLSTIKRDIVPLKGLFRYAY